MQQQEDIFKKFASAILDSLDNIPEWKNGILYIERQEKIAEFKTAMLEKVKTIDG